MNIACVLYFDEEAQNSIMGLWQKLYDNGICKEMIDTNSRPHITLGAFSDAGIEAVVEKANEYAAAINKLEINFTSISCFTGEGGVIYLAPKVTEELLELNKKFHKCFEAFDCSSHILYTPPYWVPHCTMTINIPREKVIEGVELLLKEFKPIKATISALGFAEFYPINYRHDKTIKLYKKQ